MFLMLSTMAAATTLSMAQLPFFFPRPQVMPVPSFPWMPFVGGPNSLPPWMRPSQGDNENTAEEFPVTEELPIVGGPDSLPPWLRPQEDEAMSEKVPMVGGPDSLPPWLRPQAQGPDSVGIEPWLRPATTDAPGVEVSPADRFIDNTDDTEEDPEEEAPKEERYGYGYLSGSYAQPGYYSGYSSPYTNIGTLGGFSTYPYSAGTGYANTGYAGNGYAGYTNAGTGYSGYNGYYGYYPTNTGYTYYTG